MFSATYTVAIGCNNRAVITLVLATYQSTIASAFVRRSDLQAAQASRAPHREHADLLPPTP
jgi:hypothetical protein